MQKKRQKEAEGESRRAREKDREREREKDGESACSARIAAMCYDLLAKKRIRRRCVCCMDKQEKRVYFVNRTFA